MLKKFAVLLFFSFLSLPMVANAISLADAIEKSIKNSAQLVILQKEASAADVAIEEAKYYQKQASGDFAGNTLDTGLMKYGYYVKQAEIGKKLAEMKIDNFKKQIKLEVESAYFELKSANEKIEKARVSYQYANDNAWTLDWKLQLGFATQLEWNQAALIKSQAKAEKASAERAAAVAEERLETLTGEDFDGELEDVLEPVEPSDLTEPSVVMLDKNIEVVSARENVTLAELNFSITKRYMQPHTFKYKQADISVDKAKESLKQAESSALLNNKADYYAVLNAWDNVGVATEGMRVAVEGYKSAQALYDGGLGLQKDVLSALANYKDSALACNNARLAYSLVKAKYEGLL